ncbi:acyltransferase [Streptomyces sp. NPDC055287]
MSDFVIRRNVDLGDDVSVGYFSVLGAEHKRLNVQYTDRPAAARADDVAAVRIGDRTVIGSHVLVYEGATVGADVFIDDYVRLGARSRVGDATMLLYGAKIYDDVSIGQNCRIAGFVPVRVVIGDNVTMMGHIAHKYSRPLDWSRDEPSPVLEDDVVVGIGATLVGGITLGAGSYVAAGATLTKSVPPESMVLGFNRIMPLKAFEAYRERSMNGKGVLEDGLGPTFTL